MMIPRLVCALSGAVALACKPGESAPGAAGHAAQAASASAQPAASALPPAKAAPPIEPFAGLQPWKSPRKGVEPVPPPEGLLKPWRAFVNQATPRQKKNPLWQTLPPKEAVLLRFDEPGAFQCLVNPVEIIPQPNDDNDGVATWALLRRLRCSSDGWRTWSELPHALLVSKDGTERRPIELTELFLKEPRDGKVIETVVWLRSDERRSRPPPPESEE